MIPYMKTFSSSCLLLVLILLLLPKNSFPFSNKNNNILLLPHCSTRISSSSSIQNQKNVHHHHLHRFRLSLSSSKEFDKEKLKKWKKRRYYDDNDDNFEEKQYKETMEGKKSKKKKKSKNNLSWIQKQLGVKPRGVEEIRMREAEELGGVPRSDRYSAKDWFHNMISLPYSSILRDVQSPVIAISTWATFISFVHTWLLNHPSSYFNIWATRMTIPHAPHSLMVSALGLLLVFRTNSAYQKFNEGRKIWEQIQSTSRDLSRMIQIYNHSIDPKQRKRVRHLLAAFPYLLRFRIRPNALRKLSDYYNDEEKKEDGSSSTRSLDHFMTLYPDPMTIDTDIEAAMAAADLEDANPSSSSSRSSSSSSKEDKNNNSPSSSSKSSSSSSSSSTSSSSSKTSSTKTRRADLYWVDTRTLPWRLLPRTTCRALARAQNRPLWICDRLAFEFSSIPYTKDLNFTSRERLTLLNHVDRLSRSIGACERIHQTVVPLNYARHALRSLSIWLLTLPFALISDLRLWTGPILGIISWMLFGVYEIGSRIEDPFQGTLRLSILCDAIRRDVLLFDDDHNNDDGDDDGVVMTRYSAFALDHSEDDEEEEKEEVQEEEVEEEAVVENVEETKIMEERHENEVKNTSLLVKEEEGDRVIFYG